MAADCFPRLSPPAASPARKAASSRRANGRSCDASKTRAVSSITSPAREHVSRNRESVSDKMPAPGHAFGSGVGCELSGTIDEMQLPLRPSFIRVRQLPNDFRRRHAGLEHFKARGSRRYGLTKAWVAMAPVPVSMNGTRAPTANAQVETAMARSPVASSRATIDQVISLSFQDAFGAIPSGLREKCNPIRAPDTAVKTGLRASVQNATIHHARKEHAEAASDSDPVKRTFERHVGPRGSKLPRRPRDIAGKVAYPQKTVAQSGHLNCRLTIKRRDRSTTGI